MLFLILIAIIFILNAFTITQKTNLEKLNKIKGVNITLNYDQAATLLEIKGTIDYSKIDNITDVAKPYNDFTKKDLNSKTLIDNLKKENYTCE